MYIRRRGSDRSNDAIDVYQLNEKGEFVLKNSEPFDFKKYTAYQLLSTDGCTIRDFL